MKKTEFLEQLARELKRAGVSDAEDIIEEYGQHFAFKLTDGFTEEEIAAKLGDPADVAAQFGPAAKSKGRGGSKAIAAAGLAFSGIGAGVFFILLAAWGIVLAAFSLCCAAAAVCLVAGLSPWSLIPPMPYAGALIIGVATAALAVLSTVGCIWFMAFLRQMIRVYARFNHNTMAAASGNPILPPLPSYPNFQPKTKRGLRRVLLVALSVFAAAFILGLVVLALMAGSLQFWHVWGWFGYGA